MHSPLNNILKRVCSEYLENGYDSRRGFDILGIQIGQTDFGHCRVRFTEYVGMSGKILLQGKVDHSHG